MKNSFPEVNSHFGFGMMRLPMMDGEVDFAQCNQMVDRFIESGLTYFDTAHGYLNGKSEIAVRECVVKRYPRESFTLTDKLSGDFFKTEEDILPYFETMLQCCGVSYFDFFLMHAQCKENYEKYQKCHAYEIAQELKKQGRIHHLGISFHDSADFLEKILTEHPEIELVQIQLNYLDYEDAGIQSRRCLEVCRQFGKPVVIMEPVKGGTLANLPEDAAQILQELHGGSNASYAIRFAAGCEGVMMVLSGMSNLEQMEDNLSSMANFQPLSERERQAIADVVACFHKKNIVACTGCRYCVAGCPKHILIPDVFSDLNAKLVRNDWGSAFYYEDVHTRHNGKASDCIRCGKCEQICPQHLPIRDLLVKVAETFETKPEAAQAEE